MQESFSFSSKKFIVSVPGRRILKPSLILPCISPQMKEFISGMHADACGPLDMVVSSAWVCHGGPVCVRIPSYT